MVVVPLGTIRPYFRETTRSWEHAGPLVSESSCRLSLLWPKFTCYTVPAGVAPQARGTCVLEPSRQFSGRGPSDSLQADRFIRAAVAAAPHGGGTGVQGQ